MKIKIPNIKKMVKAGLLAVGYSIAIISSWIGLLVLFLTR